MLGLFGLEAVPKLSMFDDRGRTGTFIVQNPQRNKGTIPLSSSASCNMKGKERAAPYVLIQTRKPKRLASMSDLRPERPAGSFPSTPTAVEISEFSSFSDRQSGDNNSGGFILHAR